MSLRRTGLILALAAGLTGPLAAWGQATDPVSTARRAAQMLDQAGMALQDAESASDRVAALTQTIRAYEEGLVALREGLRRAAIREQAIQLELDARSEEVARLLGVLISMQRAPETLLLLHPAGPVGTARSGMLLTEITPALQARAEALRATLEEVALLRGLQQDAEQTLRDGLAGVQDARTDLSQAISDRTDLPRRFAADPDRLRHLLQGSDTLESFASGLMEMDQGEQLPPIAGFDAAKGTLPLPVQGVVLRRMGEADAAGIRRPGLVIATPPLALVTTPTPATIRYRGPLLDYGNVMILEPSGNTLLVLAGLEQVYGDVGQVLPAGAPVGLMGGADPNVAAFLSDATEGGGTVRSETLYIELRQDSIPVDPAKWFSVRKEESR
ncbi:murein hydrolase activator EnvC [Actibacterium sp.]|uniref:murein hydrolase activator EnvC family protein n=1 Tax=Actibacterium sp. TaxID=1872125 RepID=UPI003567F903